MHRLGADSAFDRRWFVFAWFVVVWPAVMMFGYFGVRLPPESVLQAVGEWGVRISLIVTIMASLYAVLGYYLDTKSLQEADAEWVPVWWMWVIFHFLFSPLITGPVYFLLRTWNTGVPWSRDRTA